MEERRSGLFQFLKRSPVVTIPDLMTNFSTNPNLTVQGMGNSLALARMSMLRNFDIPAWEQMTRQVASYVERRGNVQKARKGRKCIDGRYAEDQSQGMIARPGGDYGYALALAALTDPSSPNRHLMQKTALMPRLSPEECLELVFDTVTSYGDQFYMHTDFHDDGTHIGCAHAAAPVEHGRYYRLFDETRASRLLYRAKQGLAIENSRGSNKFHMEHLEGQHREQAVIYVTGKNKTIKPQNAETGEMYFIYDITRDYDYMTRKLLPGLVARLGLDEMVHDSFFRNFLYLSSVHADNSLNILAGRTPRIAVDLDGFRPRVTMLEPGTGLSPSPLN